jgi:hypothetical protein
MRTPPTTGELVLPLPVLRERVGVRVFPGFKRLSIEQITLTLSLSRSTGRGDRKSTSREQKFHPLAVATGESLRVVADAPIAGEVLVVEANATCQFKSALHRCSTVRDDAERLRDGHGETIRLQDRKSVPRNAR